MTLLITGNIIVREFKTQEGAYIINLYYITIHMPSNIFKINRSNLNIYLKRVYDIIKDRKNRNNI